MTPPAPSPAPPPDAGPSPIPTGDHWLDGFEIVAYHDLAGRPGFKMGIAQLHVDRSAYELQVEVTPDRPEAGPGETVVYTVSTRDASGNPVSAELSLGLSDLATLSLMDPNSAPVLDYFYSNRNLNVWTTMPLVLSIEEVLANEGDVSHQRSRIPAPAAAGAEPHVQRDRRTDYLQPLTDVGDRSDLGLVHAGRAQPCVSRAGRADVAPEPDPVGPAVAPRTPAR